MKALELIFLYHGKPSDSDLDKSVCSLLAAWAQNGQICDKDWCIIPGRQSCRVIVSCPEEESLSRRFANKWVRKSLADLRRYHVDEPAIRALGHEHESEEADRCRRPTWYLLATDFLRLESPLRCGEHGMPVPLYRIPHTYAADPSYYDLRQWEAQWKAFDRLQMMCGPGERFATRQISDNRSELTKVGLDLCRRIETSSGVPTYYYLHRGEGRSIKKEMSRTCPSCARPWRLDKPLHHFLDFKCDHCRLVSNIAWSIRSGLSEDEIRQCAKPTQD